MILNWAFMMERVTGIEPASRAWELHDMRRTHSLSSGFDWPWLAVKDREWLPCRARRGHGLLARSPLLLSRSLVLAAVLAVLTGKGDAAQRQYLLTSAVTLTKGFPDRSCNCLRLP